MKIIESNSRYSLRNGEFHIDGDRVPVSPRVVRTALVSHYLNTGECLAGGTHPVPEYIANRILRMERARSLSQLAAELARLERAERITQEAA